MRFQYVPVWCPPVQKLTPRQVLLSGSAGQTADEAGGVCRSPVFLLAEPGPVLIFSSRVLCCGPAPSPRRNTVPVIPGLNAQVLRSCTVKGPFSPHLQMAVQAAQPGQGLRECALCTFAVSSLTRVSKAAAGRKIRSPSMLKNPSFDTCPGGENITCSP